MITIGEMTWNALAEVLQWEVAKLPESVPAPVPTSQVKSDGFGEWLAALEDETQARLDMACAEFSHFRSWPPLNLKEQYWLRLRLLVAWEFALTMASSPCPLLARKKWPDMLQWLLVSHWWKVGCDAQIAVLDALLTKAALRQEAPTQSEPPANGLTPNWN